MKCFVSSVYSSVLGWLEADSYICTAFCSLKRYPCLLHHFWYCFAKALSELPQTHSLFQNFATKSTHFSCPSDCLGALAKKVFTPGKISSSKVIKVIFSETFSFKYCRYWQWYVLSIFRISVSGTYHSKSIQWSII